MPVPPIVVTADRRDNGQTLAAVLKAHLGLSWSQAKRAIDRRHVRVGGQIVADAAFRVKAGKRITVAAGVVEARSAVGARSAERGVGSEKPKTKKTPPFSGEAQSSEPSAAPRKPKTKSQPRNTDFNSALRTSHSALFEILFSDDAVVVVNKPAGVTTVRSAEDREEFGDGQRFLPKTLADQLPPALGAPDKPVVAVHRLDRDTTGVLVFARTKLVGQKLMVQFRRHTADRRYLALVRGEPKSGRIESTLVPDRGDGRRGSGTGDEERKAVTHVKVLERFAGFALVECRLETGRTHQVRIHLGEAGNPLCGETVYDRPVNGQPLPDGSGAARPMLHAAELGFTHPTSGERMTFAVPPPADFAALLAKLRVAS
ncbi:MAG: RluA family pseudouridine synthase [Gemmataceae bacterium]|nr:RluA family pseudouridine synthase [Gemmataceae bacterium]